MARELTQKEHLHSLEMLRAAVMHELAPHSLHDSIEDRKRPAPFEDPLRRIVVRRLALIAFFAGRDFEGQDGPAAALLRATAIALVG